MRVFPKYVVVHTYDMIHTAVALSMIRNIVSKSSRTAVELCVSVTQGLKHQSRETSRDVKWWTLRYLVVSYDMILCSGREYLTSGSKSPTHCARDTLETCLPQSSLHTTKNRLLCKQSAHDTVVKSQNMYSEYEFVQMCGRVGHTELCMYYTQQYPKPVKVSKASPVVVNPRP